MKTTKIIAIILSLLLIPTSTVAANSVLKSNNDSKIEITSKNKKKKKTKKKKSSKKVANKTYNYQGTGTITSIGDDEMNLGVRFTTRNKTLGNILKQEREANILVDNNTNFTVDGDPNSDFFDICQGDFISVNIITKQKLTSTTLNTVAATKVTITTNDEDCSPISLD